MLRDTRETPFFLDCVQTYTHFGKYSFRTSDSYLRRLISLESRLICSYLRRFNGAATCSHLSILMQPHAKIALAKLNFKQTKKLWN